MLRLIQLAGWAVAGYLAGWLAGWLEDLPLPPPLPLIRSMQQDKSQCPPLLRWVPGYGAAPGARVRGRGWQRHQHHYIKLLTSFDRG